jgi:hypothetical protein
MNMKNASNTTITVFLLLALPAGKAWAWEGKEHRQLADSALAAVISECGWDDGDSLSARIGPDILIRLPKKLWSGKTFPEICAFLSRPDFTRSRLHDRGRTILEQLHPLSRQRIDDEWALVVSSPPQDVLSESTVRSVEMPDRNVAANYLLYHLMALRFADFAGRLPVNANEAFRRALVFEAAAQGYLADSFSGGHMLVPCPDVFFRLHDFNNRSAHEHYSNEGVYVVNSAGSAWRAFGDRILDWYAPSRRAVYGACAASLREVFAVLYAAEGGGEFPDRLREWLKSVEPDSSAEAVVRGWTVPRSGAEYYGLCRLPALMLVPVPVSAAWSVRTDRADEYGIHERRLYPQLREAGFHDPDLRGIDRRFLYPRKAVPDFMIPDLLASSDPKNLIRSNPDFASVRYVQDRSFPPSYTGVLVSVAGGLTRESHRLKPALSLGPGYGIKENLLPVLRFSVETDWLHSYRDGKSSYVVPWVGLGIKTADTFDTDPLACVQMEFGYAAGVGASSGECGFKIAAGLESTTVPLGFTYSGVRFRIKYQRIALSRKLEGVFLEMVVL